MSYNITNFTVKELENLMIPLDFFYDISKRDLHPNITHLHDSGITTIEKLETIILGKVNSDNVIEVTSIDCSGEGSGCVMENMLLPALIESSGLLIAVCIWEGGDSIGQLTVIDGKVEWSKIEL